MCDLKTHLGPCSPNGPFAVIFFGEIAKKKCKVWSGALVLEEEEEEERGKRGHYNSIFGC